MLVPLNSHHYFWVPKNGAPPRLGSESLPPTMVSAFQEKKPLNRSPAPAPGLLFGKMMISRTVSHRNFNGHHHISIDREWGAVAGTVKDWVPRKWKVWSRTESHLGLLISAIKSIKQKKQTTTTENILKWKRSQDISSICISMSSFMYIKMVPTRISTFLDFFQLRSSFWAVPRAVPSSPTAWWWRNFPLLGMW